MWQERGVTDEPAGAALVVAGTLGALVTGALVTGAVVTGVTAGALPAAVSVARPATNDRASKTTMAAAARAMRRPWASAGARDAGMVVALMASSWGVGRCRRATRRWRATSSATSTPTMRLRSGPAHRESSSDPGSGLPRRARVNDRTQIITTTWRPATPHETRGPAWPTSVHRC